MCDLRSAPATKQLQTHEEWLDSRTAQYPCAVHEHVLVQPHVVTHSFIHSFKRLTHARAARARTVRRETRHTRVAQPSAFKTCVRCTRALSSSPVVCPLVSSLSSSPLRRYGRARVHGFLCAWTSGTRLTLSWRGFRRRRRLSSTISPRMSLLLGFTGWLFFYLGESSSFRVMSLVRSASGSRIHRSMELVMIVARPRAYPARIPLLLSVVLVLAGGFAGSRHRLLTVIFCCLSVQVNPWRSASYFLFWRSVSS